MLHKCLTWLLVVAMLSAGFLTATGEVATTAAAPAETGDAEESTELPYGPIIYWPDDGSAVDPSLPETTADSTTAHADEDSTTRADAVTTAEETGNGDSAGCAPIECECPDTMEAIGFFDDDGCPSCVCVDLPSTASDATTDDGVASGPKCPDESPVCNCNDGEVIVGTVDRQGCPLCFCAPKGAGGQPDTPPPADSTTTASTTTTTTAPLNLYLYVTVTFLEMDIVQWSAQHEKVARAAISDGLGVPMSNIDLVSAMPGSVVVVLRVRGYATTSAVQQATASLNDGAVVFPATYGSYSLTSFASTMSDPGNRVPTSTPPTKKGGDSAVLSHGELLAVIFVCLAVLVIVFALILVRYMRSNGHDIFTEGTDPEARRTLKRNSDMYDYVTSSSSDGDSPRQSRGEYDFTPSNLASNRTSYASDSSSP